jgi:hypothetical protein
MLGEPKNQFSLTRAALGTRGAQSKVLSVTLRQLMRKLIPLLLLAVVTGCETTQTSTGNAKTIPKQTPTRVVFEKANLLYTAGLGDAGVEGFCKRLETYIARDFGERGVTVVTTPASGAEEAKIVVTLATIETGAGMGYNWFAGPVGTVRLRAKYSARLDSPSGATVATWKHEVDEDSPDKLATHMSSDIVKYLKGGFK